MPADPTGQSDRELLGAFLRDGDDAALRELVERLTPALYRVARGLTGWRTLGAQTLVERAWKVGLRRSGETLADDRALLRVLLRELVENAQQMGDSPRPQLSDDPERAEAMRAVALLPVPARTVYVLHDVGGLSSSWVAELLGVPIARVVAELWHARLAVETLRGSAAEPLAPDGTDEPSADLEGVPALWLEPVSAELLDRICETAAHRRATLASRPARMVRGGSGGLLVAVLALAGGVLLSRPSGAERRAEVASGTPVASARLITLPAGLVMAPVQPALPTATARLAAPPAPRDTLPTRPRRTAAASLDPASSLLGEHALERRLAAARTPADSAAVAALVDSLGVVELRGGGASVRPVRLPFSEEARRYEPPPHGAGAAGAAELPTPGPALAARPER